MRVFDPMRGASFIKSGAAIKGLGLCIVLCLVQTSSAQIPKLAEIPRDLPQVKVEKLTLERTGLITRRDALQARAAQFNSKCANVTEGTPLAKECEREQRQIEEEKQRYVRSATVFNQSVSDASSKYKHCIDLEKQLESDKEALRRLEKANKLALRELEEWTEASKQAEKDALLAGIKTLSSGIAAKLEDQVKSASAFKGWMTRYDRQLKSKNVNIEVVLGKLENAMRGYVNASALAKSGAAIDNTLKAADIWKLFKDGLGRVAQTKAKSDASVKEMLDDPALKAVLTTDFAGLELANSALALASQSDELKKAVGPEFALASFIVDYGYEATKWTLSYNRILQKADPTRDATVIEAELKSVFSLRRQIEATADKLKEARIRAQE